MINPRTAETEAKYEAFKQSKNDDELHVFNFKEEKVLEEFDYWYIIESRFPYDSMVRINDLLVSKRTVSNFSELTDKEHVEFHQVMDKISQSGRYDAKIENFPRSQTVKKHIHIHLIAWHNTK